VSAPAPESRTIHATCLSLGEAGILIRGEAGAGKSTLALLLLDRAARDGTKAALVGDDRVRLRARDGCLIAQPHPAIAGLIEIRGLGLHRTAARDSCAVRLVIDLVEAMPRYPDACGTRCEILGISLMRLLLDRNLRLSGLAPRIVQDAVAVASQSHSTCLFRREPEAP
jgi:HPr kinase/phosphorylase